VGCGVRTCVARALVESEGLDQHVARTERPGDHNLFDRTVIDNLLVRIHFVIVMIRWTGLAIGRPSDGTPRGSQPVGRPAR